MSNLGVYIHWPYCSKICPYCDFNVYRSRGQDEDDLVSAIIADLRAYPALGVAGPVDTVFFGGGTPSLLSGAAIARLIAAVDETLGLKRDAEITIEANPEDWFRFADHAAAGINRFSIGVQALDDASLKALGRFHTASEARRAVDAAAGTGQRVSLDLIYARAGQSLAAWEAELQAATAWPVEHLSLYQLTVEGDTAFARRQMRGQLVLPGGEEGAAFYELTQDVAEAAGFEAYEVSNHARGRAAWSEHNLLYWTGGQWLGLGPGAHGRFIGADGHWRASEALARPAAYSAAVREGARPWAETAVLDAVALGDERLVMGLRTSLGAPVSAVEALWGRGMDMDKVKALQSQGFLSLGDGVLRLTPAGRLVADRIALELAIA